LRSNFLLNIPYFSTLEDQVSHPCRALSATFRFRQKSRDPVMSTCYALAQVANRSIALCLLCTTEPRRRFSGVTLAKTPFESRLCLLLMSREIKPLPAQRVGPEPEHETGPSVGSSGQHSRFILGRAG
jgi:hypothetical protein